MHQFDRLAINLLKMLSTSFVASGAHDMCTSSVENRTALSGNPHFSHLLVDCIKVDHTVIRIPHHSNGFVFAFHSTPHYHVSRIDQSNRTFTRFGV